MDVLLTRHVTGQYLVLQYRSCVDLSNISFMFCNNKYRGQLVPTAASPVCSVQFLVRASPRITVYRYFRQSLQENAKTVPNIVSRQLPYTFSAIHHAQIPIN